MPKVYNIPIQVFTAVTKIKIPIMACNTLVLTLFPAVAPMGEAIKLATTMIIEGKIGTCPVAIFPKQPQSMK